MIQLIIDSFNLSKIYNALIIRTNDDSELKCIHLINWILIWIVSMLIFTSTWEVSENHSNPLQTRYVTWKIIKSHSIYHYIFFCISRNSFKAYIFTNISYFCLSILDNAFPSVSVKNPLVLILEYIARQHQPQLYTK